MVDLNKTDEYENFVIPDKDIETTLKVLRTLRSVYLGGPGGFNADVTVTLSHAHATIYEVVKSTIENFPDSVVPDDWDTLTEALQTYLVKWKGLKEKHISDNEERMQEIKTNMDFETYNAIQNYHALMAKYTSQMFTAQWIINSIRGGISKKHSTNICNVLWEG